eukprot:gene9984-biopygen1320
MSFPRGKRDFFSDVTTLRSDATIDATEPDAAPDAVADVLRVASADSGERPIVIHSLDPSSGRVYLDSPQ